MKIKTFTENFAAQFEETPMQKFEAETQFRELEEWDSMLALCIMAMVDEKYQTKVTPDEMKNASTILELFNVVSLKQ